MQLPPEVVEPAESSKKSAQEDPEDPLPDEYLPMESTKSIAEDDAPVVQQKNKLLSSITENADNDDELPIAALLQLESEAS